MAISTIRGVQLRIGSVSRDRIDAAFEASLAAIEGNITTIFNTMSTDSERLAAVDALTTAFQSADGTLQGMITTMVNQTRAGAGLEADGSFVPGTTNYLGASASLKAAVLALDTALKTEADARAAADTVLQNNINTLSTTITTGYQDAIDAVVAAQLIKDTAQDDALAAEVAARTAADTTLTTNLANEITARTNADTVLSDAIAAEATARTAAVSAEATTRAAADTALQAAIDAEALARTNADAVHTAAIAQEVSDRAAAVTAEATTRATADTALSDRITALEGATPNGLTYDKLVVRETPTGTIDGVNALFVLANTPAVGTEQVYLNGQQLEVGADADYTITGKDITLTTVPLLGDRVRVTYFR